VSEKLAWLRRKGEQLNNKPIGFLSEEEEAILAAYLIIRDAEEGVECISLRDYGWRLSPSKLLSLLRPYLRALEARLSELGYVRASRYSWRRWDMSSLQERWEKGKEELMKVLNVDEDAAYVVYVAWSLLKRTVPWRRDWRGYNAVHAFAVYDRFCKEKLSLDDINWLNDVLMHYEEQIKSMGLDFERIRRRRSGWP